MKNPSVFFIVPYPSEGASNRLRVEQYLPYLDRENISYRVRPFAGKGFYRILYLKGRHFRKIVYFIASLLNRFIDIIRAIPYDIIFIHREALPVGSVIVEWLFSKTGKKIIFDFDDAIFLPNTSRSNNYIERFKDPNKVSKIIELSDLVIAGNGYLAEYAKKFNDNVVVIPTPIDTDRYDISKKEAAVDGVTIGWIGSFTTRQYLESLKGIFDRLRLKYPRLRLKFVGNWTGLDGPIPGAEYKEWSLENEPADMHSFDIGIMPIPDDMWTRGKCGFKLILYMACGIPVVTSPVGMNREIIKDGYDGFFANAGDEWLEVLSRLIEDYSLRNRVGLAGRKTVEERYSVRMSARYFIDALRKA